jgi:RNA polymerase sigma factor (sigma-70 family)
MINKYNGVEYNFNTIQVVSAGERDPDADGAEGMSASKMRAAAAAGDLESFKQGVPNPEVADEMFAAVRQGMGVRDAVAAEDTRVDRRSLSGQTKSFRGTANKLPTDDTVDPKDITAKSKQVDMPDEPYDLDIDSIDKSKLKKMLPTIIDTLDGKHAKAVIGARFGLPPYEKEYTYQQIADALGISPGRVQQIEARAIRQLRHPSRSRDLRSFLDHTVNTDIGVAEGMFGIDSKTKGAIQNVVSKLSDIPGMWDHAAQTFTDEGMDKLKSVLKNNTKHIKYAVNLTADDYEAENIEEQTYDRNKLIAVVNLDGEAKEFDLTGRFQGDTRTQIKQAETFLNDFLKKKMIPSWSMEIHYQGAVSKTNATGQDIPDTPELDDFANRARQRLQQPRGQ